MIHSAKVKLFTVATHNYGYLDALKQSSKKHNYDLEILGHKQKWEGLLWKFKLMYEKITLFDDNEIICFCDGFDVIVTNDSDKMITFFTKQHCDILFGWEASNNNYLIYLFSPLFFKNAWDLSRYQRPNSGVYIGYVWAIKNFLKFCLHTNSTIMDDQDLAYLAFYNMEKIGLNMKISNSIYTVPMKEGLMEIYNILFSNIQNNYIDINLLPKNLETTYFVHANGNRNMDYLTTKLQLSNANITTTNHNHLTHYLKSLLNNIGFRFHTTI